MSLKLTTAIAAALFMAGCSNEPSAVRQAETNAPVDADDDTLKPEESKAEDDHEHEEGEAPHTH